MSTRVDSYEPLGETVVISKLEEIDNYWYSWKMCGFAVHQQYNLVTLLEILIGPTIYRCTTANAKSRPLLPCALMSKMRRRKCAVENELLLG
jgi:hypothetical protein